MAFQKGNMPWNKGKKCPYLRGNTNGFKKGRKPWNKGIKGKQSHMHGRKHTLGKKAWNKGLTKKLDNRIAQPWLGKKRSEETKKKLSRIHKESGHAPPKDLRTRGKKHHNYGKPILAKRYLRKGALKSRQKLSLRNPTNLEKIVTLYLKSKKINYKFQYLINNKFLVDFYLPEDNLIVEADGDYWHNLDRVKKKDKAENAYLAKCGFNMLRLKEEEILNGSFERRLNCR